MLLPSQFQTLSDTSRFTISAFNDSTTGRDVAHHKLQAIRMHIKRYRREGESDDQGESDDEGEKMQTPNEGAQASDHVQCHSPIGMAIAMCSSGPSDDTRTSRAAVAGVEENLRDREYASAVHRPLPVSLGSSSFKLMPRNPSAMCGPSATKTDLFGTRKRRAYSNGSSSSCSDEEQQGISISHFGRQDYSSPSRRPIASGGDLLKFEALTIHSPKGHAFKPNFVGSPAKPRNQNNILSGGSSFSLYVSSPSDSYQRACGDSISMSTNSVSASRTPSGSAKSSPRQVPLVVIPTTLQQIQACSPPRFRPSDGRPPFYINAARVQRREEKDASQHRPSCPISSSVDHIDGSDAWKSSIKVFEDPLTPMTDRTALTAATGSASPRTPLPRITLTPRTPLSSQRNKTSSLPVFPLPAGDGCPLEDFDGNDDLGHKMDALLRGFEGHLASLPLITIDHNDPSHRLTFNPDSSQSCAMSDARLEMRTPPDAQMLGSPIDLCERNSTESHALKQESLALHDVGADAGDLKVHATATPSRYRSFPSEVIRSDVNAAEAEAGSLSDSDDEGFVLACPLSLSTENRRRVKQRRLAAMDSGSELSGLGSSGAIVSNQCSNTSLFGMAIVHDDMNTDSSSTTRVMTPFSGLSMTDRIGSGMSLLCRDGEFLPASHSNNMLSRRDAECSMSSNLNRGKSEVSFASIGLCLEEVSGEAGRDLVTPPAIVQRTRSPPLFFKKPVE